MSRAAEFELGYPEIGTAYVRHPVRPQRLTPLASYHPQIMTEKVNEAIAMVTSLGASSIELGYTNSSSSDVRADPELFGLVNMGAKASKGETHTVVYKASGEGAAPRPLPPLVWIDQPGWRGIIDGRLNNKLQDFALSFTYEHRTGVDAELAAAVKRMGFRSGGASVAHTKFRSASRGRSQSPAASVDTSRTLPDRPTGAGGRGGAPLR